MPPSLRKSLPPRIFPLYHSVPGRKSIRATFHPAADRLAETGVCPEVGRFAVSEVFQNKEDRVTEEVPFYQDGLYFSCQQGCAACCKIPGRVEIDEQDIGRMAEALGMTHNRFAATYVRKVSGDLLLRERDDGACVMLGEDDRCMVHAVRPLQCRTYPFWDEVLANDFTWILEKDLCPGLDKGRWFSREEIDALRRGQAQTGGFNESAEG